MGALTEAWQEQARCQVDPDLWFDRHPHLIAEARRQCALCPVLAQCEAEAELVRPWEGVWAGVLWSAGHPRRWPRRKGTESGQGIAAGAGADREEGTW